jgi:hypothetical protein
MNRTLIAVSNGPNLVKQIVCKKNEDKVMADQGTGKRPYIHVIILQLASTNRISGLHTQLGIDIYTRLGAHVLL